MTDPKRKTEKSRPEPMPRRPFFLPIRFRKPSRTFYPISLLRPPPIRLVLPNGISAFRRNEVRPWRKNRFVFVLIGLAVLFFCARPVKAGVNKEFVIKFSHVVANNTPKGLAARKFAGLVNVRMKGRVRVEVYPDSILYNDEKVLDAMLLSGSQNQGILAAPSLSKLVRFSDKLRIFDLPFFFEDIEQIHRLIDSHFQKDLTEPLKKRGLLGLAFWDNGMKVFSVKGNKHLAEVPDDFKGKKFRIQSSSVHEEMILALGGIPQSLPFEDLGRSLQKGWIHGQENTWSNIYSQGLHETQNFITVSNHSYLGYLLVISEKFWNLIPENERAELVFYLREATRLNRNLAVEFSVEDRLRIERESDTQIMELMPEQRERWKQATAGIKDHFRPVIGENFINEVEIFLSTPPAD